MSICENMTCNDPRRCFAKGPSGGCSLLIETYPEGIKCPFAKPDRSVTNGKRYPINKSTAKPWTGMLTERTMRIKRERSVWGNESVHSSNNRTGGKFHRV